MEASRGNKPRTQQWKQALAVEVDASSVRETSASGQVTSPLDPLLASLVHFHSSRDLTNKVSSAPPGLSS